MNITDLLLPEFDAETANTRKMLERVPDNKFAWKPHEKSMPMGRLATHLGEIPGWVVETINRRELDLAPPGQPPFEPTKANTHQDVLNLFDRNVATARAALAATNNEHLTQSWSLLMGGKTILSLPRTAVLRNFVMNHMIHHRAQLGVYLRLNNIPVPATYGPSADEGNM